MEITGIIRSGAGKGAYFTQVDWVVRQCEQHLGYRPFPGTLNVQILEGDICHLKKLSEGKDFEFRPDDPAFCTAEVKTVTVNGIPGAMVIPAEDVRIHAERIVEILSACNFKRTLGLKDGDSVRLVWIDASVETRQKAIAMGTDKNQAYRDVYAFAASAGALEGFVYPRQALMAESLDNWVENIVKQYRDLPEEVRRCFQPDLDRTLGRAVQAMIPALGADHAHIGALSQLIVGAMPRSCHDFDEEKAEKAAKYGQ